MTEEIKEGLLFQKISKVVEDAEQAGWDGYGGDFDPNIQQVLGEVLADFPSDEDVDKAYGHPLWGDDKPSFEETWQGVRHHLIMEWKEKWFGSKEEST